MCGAHPPWQVVGELQLERQSLASKVKKLATKVAAGDAAAAALRLEMESARRELAARDAALTETRSKADALKAANDGLVQQVRGALSQEAGCSGRLPVRGCGGAWSSRHVSGHCVGQQARDRARAPAG
eukprot:61969-Chlamydomonas_euryale.AAC.1